jgi:hypothetical protein
MCSLNLISKYLDTTKMVTSKEAIVEFYLLFKRLHQLETGQQQESSDFRLYQGQMAQASLKKGMDRVC